MSNELCEVVPVLEQALRQRLGEQRFQLWFAEKTKWTWQNDQLTIGVPNHFVQEWLRKAFADDLQAAARATLGRPLSLQFVIDAELFQAARRRQAEAATRVPGARGPAAEEPARQDLDSSGLPSSTFPSARSNWGNGTTRPGHRESEQDGQDNGQRPHGPRLKSAARRWRRLDDFVVGACNRVALASAVAVVEAPGQEANPLVLHGPVGTGKTHLLEGIAVGLRRNQPDWRVCVVTAEEFTYRFVQAMRLGKLAAFRKQHRDCDALLLDDLHFLASKPATQEEFLHTLDALVVEGRQVAVSCDCHPRLTDQFMPELTDRLLGGALWPLMPPDQETRLGILRAKAGRLAGSPIPEDALVLLAAHLRGNVRELEGALNSLSHCSKVAGRPVDLSLARQVLSDLMRHCVRVFQVADVERAVAAALRLDAGALRTKQRGWRHTHPRMLAMFLARKHTGATYTEIGQRFGGRNHSTAVAAEKKVRQWLQDDARLTLGDGSVPVRDLVERIERELLR